MKKYNYQVTIVNFYYLLESKTPNTDKFILKIFPVYLNNSCYDSDIYLFKNNCTTNTLFYSVVVSQTGVNLF